MIETTMQQFQEIGLRSQQGCLTREDYLLLISLIPLRLKGLSFVPGSPDEEGEVNRLSWMYSTLAEWLRYLTDENKTDNPELLDAEKAKLMPRAIFSKSILDLATELLPRIRGREEQTGQSLISPNRQKPFDVLLACETQNFDELVLNSGLVGGPTKSHHEPKSMFENRFRTIADALLNVDKRQMQAVAKALQEMPDDELDDLQVLVGLALIEAAYDDDFADSDAYVGFQKALRQLASVVRRDKYWQLLSLRNGELLPHGRNAEREPNKTGTGQM